MFAKKFNKCLFTINPKSHRLTPNLNVFYQRFYSEQIKKEDPKPLENLQNENKPAEPVVEKVEPKSVPIEEPVVPKKEEVVVAAQETVVIKKEEAVAIDSQVDKQFASDKEQAAKLQTKRNNFIFIGLGVALALFSLGLYYYAMALSEEVIQKLWVPEQDFSSLTDDQILIRIENFGEKLDFPTLRAVIFEQEWPIMMCIQCLKHKEPLIRESALHVLTKMADYDEFKSVIGKRVNFGAVMNEAIKRPGLSKDDFPYHTFLAQFMDQQNVQKLTLSNNGRYFFALINMLNSQETFPRGVAIVALSKLASNNDANKLMASYGVFPTVLNYFNPYDPAMTLHNDGTYFKFQIREYAYKLLEQLYRGQNKDIALRDYDEPIARSMGRTLEEYERTVTLPFMYSEHIFKTMIGGAAMGFLWGFIRHLVKNRNLKTALTKGATRASLGTFLFVLTAQLARLASDKIPNPTDSTQALAGSLRMVGCYASFFVSKRYFPFCFFPAFLTLVTSEWPYPPAMWSYREVAYPAIDAEEYHRQIEEQQKLRQLQDAKRA